MNDKDYKGQEEDNNLLAPFGVQFKVLKLLVADPIKEDSKVLERQAKIRKAALQLGSLLQSLCKDRFQVEWVRDWEYRVFKSIFVGGDFRASLPVIELIALSEECSGWWMYDYNIPDSQDIVFVPINQFKDKYEERERRIAILEDGMPTI